MKKKFLCLMLTLVMVFSLVPSAVAANDEATQAAQTLYELGLFKGTGTNPDGTPIFDLDKTPTRNQAIIMLVRLLGKEEEALKGTWDLPFTDVDKNSTVYSYIGYAYANGLTSGTTATTYSGSNPIKANQYITFVLRAMGYVSGEDFTVSTSYEFSDKLGITNGQYANVTGFTRGDVAIISNRALDVPRKGESAPLIDTLGMERVEEPVEETPAVPLSEAVLGNWSYKRMYGDMVAFELEFSFGEGNAFSGSRYLMDGTYELYGGTYTLNDDQLSIHMDLKYLADNKVVEDRRQETYTAQVVEGGLALDDMLFTAISETPLTKRVNALVEEAMKPAVPSAPKSADYAYLAGTDFRSVRRDYASATAQCAYVYAFTDMNGDLCVLTDVRYKIISNYSKFTLHNMTTGSVINDPDSYYSRVANRYYGANKIHYMEMAQEINGYHVKMLQAMSNVLKTGVNSWDGVYVGANELNL